VTELQASTQKTETEQKLKLGDTPLEFTENKANT
jgi:hypothetical protein